MRITRLLLPAGILVAAAALLPTAAGAVPQIEGVLDLSPVAAFIGGLTYDATTDHLFVADPTADTVLEVNRVDGALVGSWPAPAPGLGPIGITHHPATDHLFYVSELDNRLYEVTRTGVLIDAVALSVPPVSVSGCTFNALSGTLFIVDDQAANMIETALDGTVIAVHSLAGFGIFDADAITFNSIDNTLFIGDDTGRRLFEVTPDGSLLVNLYDLGPAGLDTGGVEGLGFDAAGARLFLAHGASRQVFEISGVTTGGGVPVAPSTWGRIKAGYRR